MFPSMLSLKNKVKNSSTSHAGHLHGCGTCCGGGHSSGGRRGDEKVLVVVITEAFSAVLF